MMMGYLINQKYPVRLGSSRAGRTIFYNLNKARKYLQESGKEPTPRALAEELDVDESDIMWVAGQIDGGAVSLDSPVELDGETPMRDVMESGLPSPEEELCDRQEFKLLNKSIESFGEGLTDERDRIIWFQRTMADDPLTLRELGEQFDVSKERIRQIEVQLQESFADVLREELPELLA
jgi:RNA polymerase sigma-32 factor